MNSLRRHRLRLQLEREELRLRCAAQRSAWVREAPLALPGSDLARGAARGGRRGAIGGGGVGVGAGR